MKWLTTIGLIVSIHFGIVTLAKTQPTSKAVNPVKKKPLKKLEKSLSFSDRVVNGKHQVPGEGIVTVEDEKPTFNLLSIRSDFKDRREKEQQRD